MPTQNIFDLVDTWASGGGPYTSIKMNATDNDVSSASLLMDLQVGGTSAVKITKQGYLGATRIYPTLSAFPLYLHSTSFGVLTFTRQQGVVGASPGVQNEVASLGYDGTTYFLGLANTASIFTIANDLFLTRRAAANLRFGAADAAAPVAQTLSVQSVVAGTTNTAGTNLTITGSQGTGTGAGGSIIFQVAPAGSTGTAQNALATALTINSARNLVVTNGAFIRTDGAQPNSGVRIGGGAFDDASISTESINTSSVNFSTGRAGSGFTWLALNSTGYFGFGNSSNLGTGTPTLDVTLFRDAANTLALRNGTAAQAYNTYGTYTDGSNYRRVALAMTTAGVATLKPEGAGTGASGNVLHISGLPTSNPGPGILWNNAGTPAIGT